MRDGGREGFALPRRGRVSADWKCIRRTRNAPGRAGARRGMRAALARGKPRMNHRSGRVPPSLRNAKLQRFCDLLHAGCLRLLRHRAKFARFVVGDSFREFFIEKEYVECTKLSRFMHEVRWI